MLLKSIKITDKKVVRLFALELPKEPTQADFLSVYEKAINDKERLILIREALLYSKNSRYISNKIFSNAELAILLPAQDMALTNYVASKGGKFRYDPETGKFTVTLFKALTGPMTLEEKNDLLGLCPAHEQEIKKIFKQSKCFILNRVQKTALKKLTELDEALQIIFAKSIIVYGFRDDLRFISDILDNLNHEDAKYSLLQEIIINDLSPTMKRNILYFIDSADLIKTAVKHKFYKIVNIANDINFTNTSEDFKTEIIKANQLIRTIYESNAEEAFAMAESLQDDALLAEIIDAVLADPKAAPYYDLSFYAENKPEEYLVWSQWLSNAISLIGCVKDKDLKISLILRALLNICLIDDMKKQVFKHIEDISDLLLKDRFKKIIQWINRINFDLKFSSPFRREYIYWHSYRFPETFNIYLDFLFKGIPFEKKIEELF